MPNRALRVVQLASAADALYLFGWLISNVGSTTLHLLVGGCLAVIAITVGIVLLHRQIERQIQELREL